MAAAGAAPTAKKAILAGAAMTTMATTTMAIPAMAAILKL
jgi:hypothetical protein